MLAYETEYIQKRKISLYFFSKYMWKNTFTSVYKQNKKCEFPNPNLKKAMINLCTCMCFSCYIDGVIIWYYHKVCTKHGYNIFNEITRGKILTFSWWRRIAGSWKRRGAMVSSYSLKWYWNVNAYEFTTVMAVLCTTFTNLGFMRAIKRGLYFLWGFVLSITYDLM